MKLFGHPIHVMLIHFPAALFPMELVYYFIFYKTGNDSFADASLYAMIGGAGLGWFAVITGAIDLILIKDDGSVQAKALIHGTLNSVVVVAYSIIAWIAFKDFGNTAEATVTMLLMKALLNILMIVGNYLGGDLVLKYRIGQIEPKTTTT